MGAAKSTYSTNDLARSAATALTNAVTAPISKYDDLNNYVDAESSVRQDYAPLTDYGAILAKYDAASDAAWDLARAQQEQAMNAAESQNYASTKAGIADMRKNLAGSAASGASKGAANATALQALLGLGATNSNSTTAAMQGYQNAAKEAAAARAANAVTALEAQKGGLDSMYGAATTAYSADRDALGQAAYGAGQGLGTTGAAMDTNASSERMNNATNQTNLDIAKTHTKQTIYNKK